MLLNEQEWNETFKGIFQGEVLFGVDMKGRTSLGIGGAADALTTPEDPLSMRNLLVVLRKNGIPFTALGRGTNVLVRDGGVEGVTVSLNAFNRIEVLREGNTTAELFVEAGVPLQKLVNFCKEKGYSGIEGLTGIPGSVGGAIYGNAGSFGYEIKDALVSVAIIDAKGVLERFKAAGLGFEYRRSEIPEREIVLSANIRFRRDDPQAVSSRVGDFFKEKKQRQPVWERSAGCVFKNPEGGHAGRLIDEAGCKGMAVGGVEVSQVHANFFINRGGGTASDFMTLMDRVAEKVKEAFGVVLEPEIVIIGRQ